MEASGDRGSRGTTLWTQVLRTFEHIIVLVLTGLLMVVVAVATGELAWLLLKDLLANRGLPLDVGEMFELFGFFLLILIGVELLTTLKVYVRDGAVHIEVVLEVAIIAIAQKVIVLDTARTGVLSLVGLAALLLALASAYWAVHVVRRRSRGTAS
jgi:uncharacterized membrane protein (DUF373 family)